MLTELQKSRIKYHLDVTYRDAFEEVQADFKLQLNNIQPQRELAIVGNQAELDYEFFGELLCQTNSLLYKCEVALSRLSPDTVDVSLFVANTEEVRLRGNELRNRTAMYKAMVDQLYMCFDLDRVHGIGYYGLGGGYN